MKTPADTFLFEQIAESIRIQIARGELAPGDRLPSMRETAARWQCTPGTVNRAYAVLAEEGLISSHRGGGTRVADNPFGAEATPLESAILINQIESLFLNLLSQGYSEEQVEAAFTSALGRWQSLKDVPLRPTDTSRRNELRFVGSHDLAIENLAMRLEQDTDCRLRLSFRGSLGGLIALARGDAHVAGSHLWDEQTNEYNIPFVRRVLPGQRVALVTVASRSFGLMTPSGNPQRIVSLRDLPRVEWVNRQAGSGTRVWLDAQLRRLSVDTASISGYHTTKSTHSEVAEAIQHGSAQAGIGIEAAAKAHGLDFVPLAEELYQLVVPEAVMEAEACEAMLEILNSEGFHKALHALGGYRTAATGEITWIN